MARDGRLFRLADNALPDQSRVLPEQALATADSVTKIASRSRSLGCVVVGLLVGCNYRRFCI